MFDPLLADGWLFSSLVVIIAMCGCCNCCFCHLCCCCCKCSLSLSLSTPLLLCPLPALSPVPALLHRQPESCRTRMPRKFRRLPLLMLTLIEVLRPPESKKALLRHASAVCLFVVTARMTTGKCRLTRAHVFLGDDLFLLWASVRAERGNLYVCSLYPTNDPSKCKLIGDLRDDE